MKINRSTTTDTARRARARARERMLASSRGRPAGRPRERARPAATSVGANTISGGMATEAAAQVTNKQIQIVAAAVAIFAALLAFRPNELAYVLAGACLTVVHRFSLRLTNGVTGLVTQLKLKKW